MVTRTPTIGELIEDALEAERKKGETSSEVSLAQHRAQAAARDAVTAWDNVYDWLMSLDCADGALCESKLGKLLSREKNGHNDAS